jgi:serine protease
MPNDSNGSWGRREFLRATGSIGAMTAIGGIASAERRTAGPKPDELVVGITSGERLQTAQLRVRDVLPASADVVHRNETLGYLAVRFPGKSKVSATSTEAERLRRVPGVKYVEENHTLKPCFEPGDPKFDDQYAPQLVNAPEAWETTTGSQDVTIAIVDMGVDYEAEDLADQFGRDVGNDFVGVGSDPMPDLGEDHGMHVAGIAAATIDNGTGISGIANARLLSCRAMGTWGGSGTDIADAVQWAADQGADLINLSLGTDKPVTVVKDAIVYALGEGALSICGAGNDDGKGDLDVTFPAAFDETIAVSAIDSQEQLWEYSHRGEKVDLTAPGVDVLSTVTSLRGGADYETWSGTSMATPVVTGVAALGLAVHPEWGPSELRKHLKASAVDIGLPAEEQGAGRVDAANMVAGGDVPDGSPNAKMEVSTTEPDVGEDVRVDASASTDPDGEIVEYRWDYEGTEDVGSIITPTPTEPGPYDVALTVMDDDGNTDTDSRTLQVGDGGGSNQAPTADFSVWPPNPKDGFTVTLDAGSSTDPDGRIVEYYWTDGSGESVTGETLRFESVPAGLYEITLRVTDDDGATGSTTKRIPVGENQDGATDSLSKPISVASKDGRARSDKQVDRATGTLADVVDGETFSYTTSLPDPAQVVVTLEGPDDADFDLYATTDGRDPLVYDYDKRSCTVNSDERIVLEDVDRGQTIGVLVDSWSGSGDFAVTIEELGN